MEKGAKSPPSSELWSVVADQPFFGAYLLQDDRFVYVNERFAQILGYTVEEVMHLPSVLDTVYEDDRPLVADNIRRRLTGEVEQIRYSLRGRRKDGSPVELEVQGRRVTHEGRPAVIGVQCDVSERARDERTYHARQKAEALGAMASGVAHDFKNILSVIDGNAELMALANEGSQADGIAAIREATRRGSNLCQRLMSFGAEKRGQTETSASVNGVLFALSPILERLLAHRRIRVRMTLADALPPLSIGVVELEQVVMNLVVNAGDASLDDSEVHLSASPTEDGRVRLEVRDRGTGIAPEHLSRIFEPYFTTKGDQGNGLGLRTVWQIVTGAGGTVQVESERGRGSIFSVLVPVRTPPVVVGGGDVGPPATRL